MYGPELATAGTWNTAAIEITGIAAPTNAAAVQPTLFIDTVTTISSCGNEPLWVHGMLFEGGNCPQVTWSIENFPTADIWCENYECSDVQIDSATIKLLGSQFTIKLEVITLIGTQL